MGGIYSVFTSLFFFLFTDAPACKASQKTLYGVARGEVVNISCEVEADPSEVSFRWALNNSVENLELQSFVSNGSQSILSFTPRTMLEYGALLCWSRNAVGEQKDPCVVRVIPAGKCESNQKKKTSFRNYFAM